MPGTLKRIRGEMDVKPTSARTAITKRYGHRRQARPGADMSGRRMRRPRA